MSIKGAATINTLDDAASPSPALADVTLLVVATYCPGAIAVTTVHRTHPLCADMVAFERTKLEGAVAVIVPSSHTGPEPSSTTNAAGNTLVNATSVSASSLAPGFKTATQYV